MTRLVTWNMQGAINWTYLNYVRVNYEPDVLCLQECGRPPQANQYTPLGNGLMYRQVNFGTQKRPMLADVLWWQNVNHIQQSLAIISFVNIGDLNLDTGVQVAVVPQPPTRNPNNSRPLIWITITHNNNPCIVGCLHGPSIFNPAYANLNQAAKLRQIAAWNATQLIQFMNFLGNNQWVCLGDYNTPPNILGQQAGGVSLVWGADPTHQIGVQIDYLATALGNAPNITWNQYITIPNPSDHYPQLFIYT